MPASSSRGDPQTLGAEWMLLHAFAWRRALARTARDHPQPHARLDAVPPPALDPRPGATAPGEPEVRAIADKVAPLRLAVRDDAPERVNLLIPSMDLRHFFGGYIAKLNLARRLAERGLRVRVVTVDPVGSLPVDWRAQIEAYSGLDGVFDRVEVAFGRESHGLEVSRSDRFIATTWWTAHIADAARRELGGERFLYLIQEYEPFTFPMGTYAALADASYRLPHTALFSTELLRDWFRLRGLGVFASGAGVGRVPERDHADRPARRRRAGRAGDAPAAVLRAPGAPRGPQHVRARRARARSRRRGRACSTAGRSTASGRWRGGGGWISAAARRSSSSRAPPRATTRALLREHDVGPRADVHAAPEPRPARDGLGGHADRHQHVREQDRGGAHGDLGEPAWPRRRTSTRWPRRSARRSRARATPSGAAAGSRVAWSRDWDTSFPDALLDAVVEML